MTRVRLSPFLAILCVALSGVHFSRRACPEWVTRRPDFAHRASLESVSAMLREIVAERGREGAKAILGVPGLTLRHWQAGEACPTTAARRLILIVWLLVVKRYPINEFDIVTDGRFALDCGNDTPTGSVLEPSACDPPHCGERSKS